MLKGGSHFVNVQRRASRVFFVWPVLLLTGCGTFWNHPREMEAVKYSLVSGGSVSCEQVFSKETNGVNSVLMFLEWGRTAQLQGDIDASKAAFDGAMRVTAAQDDKAVISASGAAQQAAASGINDRVIPYRAPGYERALLHHYQALNYLAQQDIQAAGVEVRRANFEQEAAAKTHEQEVARASSRNDNGAFQTVYAGLDEAAGQVKSSFQNAYIFYVSGLIREMFGDPNGAYIDYKRAMEIHPEHKTLRQDVLRLGERLGMRSDVSAFLKRFTSAKSPPIPDGYGSLAVIVEDRFVMSKEEISIPIPMAGSGTFIAVSLPTYGQKPPPPGPVLVLANQTTLGQAELICDFSALAARALREKLPGIITRQIIRATAKGVAAKQAADSGGDWAALLVMLFNLSTEQADLRSWLTLPAYAQMGHFWLPSGSTALELKEHQGHTIWNGDVTIMPGRTTWVYAAQFNSTIYVKIFYGNAVE